MSDGSVIKSRCLYCYPFSDRLDRLYTGSLSKTAFLEINSSCVLPFLQYEWNFPSTRVAFLLANLNPDFAIENSIFLFHKY